MKILLTALNAKYIHSNPAVYSLRAYAGKVLWEHVEIAEYTINHQLGEILADIYKKNPDVIAFSCYIWNWTMIQDILTELSKILPGRPIWLGGPEVSFDAPDILAEYPQITGIMIGEGEETFRELVEYYVNRGEASKERSLKEKGSGQDINTCQKDLKDIAGLALPSGYTSVRELTDMNRIPFLYTNWEPGRGDSHGGNFDSGNSDCAAAEGLQPFENRIIYYESSRGCPYSCSYCLSSIDKKVRFRDIDVVKAELQFFLDHRVPQVKFVDRTFNCRHEHAMAVWQYIYNNDNGVTNFHFEVSADILNEEELTLLNKMRPGLVQLEIGVQSANPATIKEIKRVMDLEKLERIVSRIREGNNIHAHLDLIAGLPFEDYESFGRSFDRVYAMQPQQLQLGFLKVLKGSYMYEKADEYQLIYLDKPPYEVLSTAWLSYAEVLRLKQVEKMVELYYNSNQFTHTLPVLAQKFSGAFAMFEAMADFYREQGYFTHAPARAYRYQVLLQFAKKVDPEKEALYKELLTFDMYLRENLKSRPEFARDLQSFKEELRSFYKQEEEARKYLSDYAAYDSRQLSKMTHLEPFTYSVWNSEVNRYEKAACGGDVAVNVSKQTDQWETTAHGEVAGYVLFDYRNRSPLTGEARTIILRKKDDKFEEI